jgi:hypothetical protein
MRVICILALGRPDLDDHWKSLHSEQAFETVRSRLCSILASTITAVSCPCPRELRPTLTYSYKGKCPPRYQWCFRQYGLSCAILWLHITRSSLPALFVAHARHDRDVDIWLKHDTLGTHRSTLDSRGKGHSCHAACTDWPQYDQQLKPGGYFVLSYLLSIVTPIFFVAWSLNCFMFGELFLHSMLSLVPHAFHSDVDSRLLLPKRHLSRRHCALDGHIRRQCWHNIDWLHVEVCKKPQITLDRVVSRFHFPLSSLLLLVFPRLSVLYIVFMLWRTQVLVWNVNVGNLIIRFCKTVLPIDLCRLWKRPLLSLCFLFYAFCYVIHVWLWHTSIYQYVCNLSLSVIYQISRVFCTVWNGINTCESLSENLRWKCMHAIRKSKQQSQ